MELDCISSLGTGTYQLGDALLVSTVASDTILWIRWAFGHADNADTADTAGRTEKFPLLGVGHPSSALVYFKKDTATTVPVG